MLADFLLFNKKPETWIFTRRLVIYFNISNEFHFVKALSPLPPKHPIIELQEIDPVWGLELYRDVILTSLACLMDLKALGRISHYLHYFYSDMRFNFYLCSYLFVCNDLCACFSVKLWAGQGQRLSLPWLSALEESYTHNREPVISYWIKQLWWMCTNSVYMYCGEKGEKDTK